MVIWHLGSKDVAGNNNSGSIDITNTGSITTLGISSSGLLVQSISSGGGVVAGKSLNGELVLGSSEENQTNNNDYSGAIAITNTASGITTFGENSNAFVVQSIAGGGGYVAGNEEKLTLGSTKATNVNSGSLDIYNASNIDTFGDSSAGLVAQTVSGGGGFVGSTTATEITLGGDSVRNGGGGSIQLRNIGDITTVGDSSPLMVVQSVGGVVVSQHQKQFQRQQVQHGLRPIFSRYKWRGYRL